MNNDYLLRQIELTARAVALFIANKKEDGEYQFLNQTDGLAKDTFLAVALKRQLLQGKLDLAENILFDVISQDTDPCYLPIALDFYQQLRGMSDDALAQGNFSRQEIKDGLAAICEYFTVPVDCKPEPPAK